MRLRLVNRAKPPMFRDLVTDLDDDNDGFAREDSIVAAPIVHGGMFECLFRLRNRGPEVGDGPGPVAAEIAGRLAQVRNRFRQHRDAIL